MRDHRSRLSWLVGLAVFVMMGVPRAGDARITFVQEEGIDDGEFEYAFIGDVVVSPDDRFVYAATAYSPNWIVVYERVSESGALEEVDIVTPPAPFATILAMSPDGLHLYALDYITGGVLAYARDGTTGLLTFLHSVQPPTDGINQQWQGMTISPDGKHVYATSFGRDGIAVYARDAGTGAVALVDFQTGIAGLVWPIGLAVSPDGGHVYVSCYRPTGAVVVLARDATTGLLTGVQDIENGSGGHALTNQFAVAVAPDGAHVYVSGSQGITAYARNAATGVLTWVQSTIDGSDHEVLVSADGARAYACGAGNGVRGYARNPVTGVLTGDEQHLPFEEGFAPPLFCFGMAMTSAGRHFYAITTYDLDQPGLEYAYTIGVFRRLNSTCSDAPLAGCQTPVAAGAGTVKLRAGASGRLSWKLRAPGSAADFGDPVGGATDVALCMYDDRGSFVKVVAPGSAPCTGGHTCWRARSLADARYSDSKTRRDGLKRVKLQDRAGQVRLGVDGRPGFALPTFPLQGPVTVQLQLSDGTASSCWTSTYSAPSRNDGLIYRAASDP
jgi:DNA-binding beta-propeller fold protein YncE